jgi:nicotinamide riboside kinase
VENNFSHNLPTTIKQLGFLNLRGIICKRNGIKVSLFVMLMICIAYGQTKFENYSLSIANKYLFCDTNLLVTKVFSEVYYNYCDPLLDKAAQEHEYDLFFLTDIDVPWKKTI